MDSPLFANLWAKYNIPRIIFFHFLSKARLSLINFQFSLVRFLTRSTNIDEMVLLYQLTPSESLLKVSLQRWALSGEIGTNQTRRYNDGNWENPFEQLAQSSSYLPDVTKARGLLLSDATNFPVSCWSPDPSNWTEFLSEGFTLTTSLLQKLSLKWIK